MFVILSTQSNRVNEIYYPIILDLTRDIRQKKIGNVDPKFKT